MLPVSLVYPFLIAPSVFSNVYLKFFISEFTEPFDSNVRFFPDVKFAMCWQPSLIYNRHFVRDHPMINDVQFGLNQIYSFRDKYFFSFSHIVQEIK
jgi:hypothetical protein